MLERDYFLKKHGIKLKESASPEEQNHQMKIAFGVQGIETGDKPYIFVSYSHIDSAVVLPAIKALQDKGYPVWYDDILNTGVVWKRKIEERIEQASLVMAFMSDNSIASRNCIAEVDHAIDLGIPMFIARLDPCELPKGQNMYLKQTQMLDAYLYDGDAYIRNLVNEPLISQTVGAKLKAYHAEVRRREDAEAQRRHEAEEAERRRKEAEEAERQRKRAEAEERRRKQAEEIENRHRKQLELERKLAETVAALETERELRVAAEKAFQNERELKKTENKLSNAQRRIANLETGTSNRTFDVQKPIEKKENSTSEIQDASPKLLAARTQLEKLYRATEEAVLKQNHKSYNQAIVDFKTKRDELAKKYPKLRPDVRKSTDKLCDILYHDARVLEKRRKNRLAYSIYEALPGKYCDREKRMKHIEYQVHDRAKIWAWIVFVVALIVNLLCVNFYYDVEGSFWINVAISVCPMIVAVPLHYILNYHFFERFFLGVYTFLGFLAMAVISLIVCPFLYPEMKIWVRILCSIGYNVAAFIIAFVLWLWLTGVKIKDWSISPVSDS